MKEYIIDFSTYDYQQLINALEGIDIDQYPDSALEIYQRILNHLNIDYQQVTIETLGYQEDNLLESIFHFLSRNILTGILLAEEDLVRDNMREKILQLNRLLSQQAVT